MTSRIDYNNPHGLGELGLPYHYEMLSDKKRVIPFRNAIRMHAKGQVVIESGTGSGIMSILAAKAGARVVYAVEIDPIIAEYAAHNFRSCGVEKKVRLIRKSIFDVLLDDLEGQMATLVIAENLSTWQVTEPHLRVMNHINRNLVVTSAVRIPTRILNYLELATSTFEFEGVSIRTHFFEFTGIKGPRLLSKKVLFKELDMSKINALEMSGEVIVKVEKSGVLNSLRLTSPLEVVSGIHFANSDSLMPPVIVPLVKDVLIHKGDKIRVKLSFTTNTSWEKFMAEADVVS